MKLTYEDNLEIYKLRKNGRSWPQLSQTHDVNSANLRRYMVKFMDRYGVVIVKKTLKKSRLLEFNILIIKFWV